MWGAIFGDVLIVLGVVFAACLLVGAANLKRLEQRGWLALLLVGFVASVLLEWLAQVLGLWGYSNMDAHRGCPWTPSGAGSDLAGDGSSSLCCALFGP